MRSLPFTKNSRQFDISKIDFDLLGREFAKAANKHLIMKDLEDLVAKGKAKVA